MNSQGENKVQVLPLSVFSKLSDFISLAKPRLSSLVVFSSLVGYLTAASSVDYFVLICLLIGGFLVTASSNAINQIIEKDYDSLMDRTKNRPLPGARLTISEAILFSVFTGGSGLLLLFVFVNPLTGWLATLSLVLYTALYTPLKRITPYSVAIGAIPGAIPPMLGYIAYTGKFGLAPGLFFLVQFMWQFPHFWAIAWKLHDDYSKAGFKLLPSAGGRDKHSSFQMVVYSAFLIPVSMLPYLFGITGILSGFVAIAIGVLCLYYAVLLFATSDNRFATKLMFASFLYLPAVQLLYLFDKI